MFTAIPGYGDGHPVPLARTNQPPAPAPGNGHQWVATVLFTVTQQTVEECAAAWMAGHVRGIDLDHENLLSVHGPECLKCRQGLSPTTYAAPCPVHVIPILGR